MNYGNSIGRKETRVGSIPIDWDVVQLEDALCLLTDGSHFSPKETAGTSYYIATVKDLSKYNITINTCKRISEVDYSRLVKSGCKPEVGDVLFSKDGTMGICFVYKQDKPVVLLSSIAILRPNKDFDSYFLKQYLSNNATRDLIISGHSSGSALPRLTLTNLKTIPVIKPPITEQKKIGKILTDLDSKIELNQKINKTLESIAQTIFKHWFIDFEFPDENGHPYKSSGGEMVDSELGEIPLEWKTKSLDEVAHFLNGLPLQKYPAKGGEDFLPVIKIKEMNNGISESTDRANLKVPKDYIVENGDVLFAWSGSLGIVIWGSGKGALNQHLFKVTSDYYPKWFYYYWLLHYLSEFIDIAKDKATTMGHIQRHHLSESTVAVPDSATLRYMDRVFSPIMDRIINTIVEGKLLSDLRNSLLPKLISGTIRVPLEEEHVN